MASILDQYLDDDKLETISEEQILEKKPKKKLSVNKTDNLEIEEKREQLSILAVLGTIDSYTGVKMSLGDVKRLPTKDVEKYYNRYQVIMGNKVTNGLVNTAIEAVTELVSYVIPIDDKKKLCSDLQNNDLVKNELNNVAGYLVLKGGRFVALASGLLQIAKHVKASNNNDNLNQIIDKTVNKHLESLENC